MNLVQQVRNSLKWKKSDFYCASKLGISIEKYKEIKRTIQFSEAPVVSMHPRVTEFKEDLDKGSAEIKGFSTTEPRSPEEISEARLEVCRSCEFYRERTNQCKKCGCFMKLKTKLENARCPLGKW